MAGQETNRLIVLFTCALFFKSGTQLRISNQNLKTIPTNIPKDTVGLYLADNSISTIATTDLSELTKFESFYIPRNSLTTVEDGSFADLRSLTTMVLSENRLKKFPDFNNIKNTVQFINLDDNFITVVAETDVEHLTTLRALGISNNPLIRIPDFETLLTSLTTLNLERVKLTCCWKVAYLKNVPDAVLSIDAIPCKYPPQFVDVAWNNIKESDMWADPCGENTSSGQENVSTFH